MIEYLGMSDLTFNSNDELIFNVTEAQKHFARLMNHLRCLESNVKSFRDRYEVAEFREKLEIWYKEFSNISFDFEK